MPGYCSVYKCGVIATCEIKLHSYPFHDEERLQKWIKFSDRGPTWYPKKSSKLCGMHFVNPKFDARRRMLSDPVRLVESNGEDSYNVQPTKTLSFSNIKITLPTSQSGIAFKKDGIYFGVHSAALATDQRPELNIATEKCPELNKEKEVEIEIRPPPTKRLKLQICIICQNVAQDLESDKKVEYAKVLINNVIPGTDRDNEDLNNFNIYNFCMPCSNTLEDLQQLITNLENIQRNIGNKINEIKFSIFESPTVEDKDLPGISTFRQIATSDYRSPNSSRGIVDPEKLICNDDGISKNILKINILKKYRNAGRKRKVKKISSKDPMEGLHFEDQIEEEQPVAFNPWENSPLCNRRERVTADIDNVDRDCLMYVEPKVKRVWPKPPLDFQQLCIIGIVSAKNRKINVNDLCNFIGKNFPIIKSNSEAKTLVRKAVSTNDVFQMVNYEALLDSTIKQKQNRSNYIPFWTVVETKLDEYRPQLIEILGSRELTQSLASSEMAQTFINNVSEKVPQVNSVDSNWKRWSPPPFSYRQIIFFALVNQSIPVSTSQIINYFKETFPYFSLLRDWDYGVFFNLQSEYFTEEDISPSSIPRRLAYSINPDKAEEIKESLMFTLRTVDTSQLNPKHFMRKPENLQDILNSTAIILKIEREECKKESFPEENLL